ncbi:MAG: hypothetical protein V7720_16755 [Halioglobus sp.]
MMSRLAPTIGLKNSGLSGTSNCQKRSKPQNTQPINKHGTTLITFFALLPLVYFVPDAVARFLPAIKWLNVTVAVGIIVPIISYVVMPAARLVFSRGH